MTGSELIFTVHVQAEKRDNEMFAPRVSALRQERRSYRTQLLELEEELFFTETAAINYAIETVGDLLKKQHPGAEVRFTVKRAETEEE